MTSRKGQSGMTDRYGMSLFLGVLKLLRDVSELVCEMLARDDLGELDGVERGSLAQIVVGDEEREALIVVDGLGSRGCGRRSSASCRRRAARWGCR